MNKSRSKLWVALVMVLLVLPAAMAVAEVVLTHSGAMLAAAAPAPNPGFQWVPFLGPFHSVMLHYPIGFISLAFLLDLIYLRRRNPELRKILVFLLMLSAVSAVIAAALGLFRAAGGGYDEATLVAHRNYGIALAVLTILTWGAQWFAFQREDKLPLSILYRTLFAGTMLLMVIAGHEGGNLTHGSAYLTQFAPEFVKKVLKESEVPKPSPGAIADPGVKFFHDKVQPVFEARCYECHGKEKQKGKYRMDIGSNAVKGGESGRTAIKPKDPLASNLVRVILLRHDDDDVMPPAGKSVLTAEETMAIVQWIQLGAPFPDQPAAAQSTASATNAPAAKTSAKAEASVKVEAPVAPAVVAVPAAPTASAAASDPASASGPSVGRIDFVTRIKPILEKDCLSCHGAEKQKGKLRLDTLEFALKGGSDNGPSIIPENADKSPFITRLLISPKNDKNDELMPPVDKGGPLSKEDIVTLIQWVNEGASWPKEVALQTVKRAAK